MIHHYTLNTSHTEGLGLLLGAVTEFGIDGEDVLADPAMQQITELAEQMRCQLRRQVGLFKAVKG